MWTQSGTLLRAGVATLGLGLFQTASATILYASTYGGSLYVVNFTLSSEATALASTAEILYTDQGCMPNPTWLTLDKPEGVLYCLDEGMYTVNGSLTAYQTSESGALTLLNRTVTPGGPVAATLYGANNSGIALADYGSSSLSSYIKDPESLALVQEATWSMSTPGPKPDQQAAPHPHEAITDPTGAFLIVPDLGADLVRVFKIDQASLQWTPLDALVVEPGSGPRHAAFAVSGDKTFMYLTSELANTVTGFAVTYNADDTLSFEKVYEDSAFGPGTSLPDTTYVSEVVVSPDQQFVIVSMRYDASFNITSVAPFPPPEMSSDSLINYAINTDTGALEYVERFEAGGVGPRQFSINKAGDLLAVGLQKSSLVAFITRDVESGNFGIVAQILSLPGSVTSIIFDE